MGLLDWRVRLSSTTGIKETTHERCIGFRRRGKIRWRESNMRHEVLGIR